MNKIKNKGQLQNIDENIIGGWSPASVRQIGGLASSHFSKA
jgi:hypothetical protein